MNQPFVIAAIIAATIIGDYVLKLASDKENFLSPYLFAGLVLYALPAFGWMHLMKTQSLAQIGIIYSTGTILALFLMSLLVFREALSTRDFIAGLFALCAIIVYKD
jgi:drug/metabolite transporter (DMT)-like permease